MEQTNIKQALNEYFCQRRVVEEAEQTTIGHTLVLKERLKVLQKVLFAQVREEDEFYTRFVNPWSPGWNHFEVGGVFYRFKLEEDERTIDCIEPIPVIRLIDESCGVCGLEDHFTITSCSREGCKHPAEGCFVKSHSVEKKEVGNE